MVELLAAASWATRFVPRLARWVGRVWATIGVLLHLLGSLIVLVMLSNKNLHVDAHVVCQSLASLVVLHDATPSVVLAMPVDFFASGLVESKAEWWLILPHLPSDVVTATQLICKSLAILVKDKAAHTAECLCSKELHLGIWIVWFHKAGWVYLHPLQINGFGTNGLTHLYGIPRAMLTIGCGQMQQVWPVLGKQ